MNRDAYNKISAEWDAARRSFYGREREYLDVLLSGLPQGSRVVDLGCGTGRPMAEYALSKGYRVTGIDQSENLLSLARASFPTESWILSAIEDYTFPETFGAAIAWDSLFHIAREHHQGILGKVVASLTESGRIMVTVGGSAHPPFTDVMFGQEFFYDSHTPEETQEILMSLGCHILIAEFMNRPSGKKEKGRYAIVAEKAG